jgi:hypothetical protein
MIFKYARSLFVWTFTALFAFLAMFGEGLHFVPGLGHSYDCSVNCCLASRTDPQEEHPLAHPAAPVLSEGNAKDINNAADCAICKYFSHAKPLLAPDFFWGDYPLVAEKTAVCPLIFQSRFVCAYHSRAPPYALFQV